MVAVIDVFGHVLPETQIIVTTDGGDAEFVTDQDGRVIAEDLGDGEHRLVAKQPGFVDGVVDAVPIQRGCVTAMVVPLQVVDVVD